MGCVVLNSLTSPINSKDIPAVKREIAIEVAKKVVVEKKVVKRKYLKRPAKKSTNDEEAPKSAKKKSSKRPSPSKKTPKTKATSTPHVDQAKKDLQDKNDQATKTKTFVQPIQTSDDDDVDMADETITSIDASKAPKLKNWNDLMTTTNVTTSKQAKQSKKQSVQAMSNPIPEESGYDDSDEEQPVVNVAPSMNKALIHARILLLKESEDTEDDADDNLIISIASLVYKSTKSKIDKKRRKLLNSRDKLEQLIVQQRAEITEWYNKEKENIFMAFDKKMATKLEANEGEVREVLEKIRDM